LRQDDVATGASSTDRVQLERLIEIGILLGSERDPQKLLHEVLFRSKELSNCKVATIFLLTDENTLRFALRTNDDPLPLDELPLVDPDTGEPVHKYIATHAALSGEVVIIDDVYSETRFDLSGTRKFSDENGIRAISLLTVPMKLHDGTVIGLIQLMNAVDRRTGAIGPFNPSVVNLIKALAAQAAVAIDKAKLIDAQAQLLDAVIRLIAGAIDAKSHYTGGHCARVPEIAMMLAEAASADETGPLKDFRFTDDDQWREFRIGAWLHDCGKVTTPEHVVDKATKLETIHNRIHEVRTRFEVLLRDAEIARLRAVHEEGVPVETANAAFAARRDELFADFAFVAECNLGTDQMDGENVARLQRIAQNGWLRHFDDRLGLSEGELHLRRDTPQATLPAQERLLADKPHHVVPRGDKDRPDPSKRFSIQVPENLYDFGELHNLSVRRGTLTAEERYKVNEHIVHTIAMLEALPLPGNLQRVPEYAGTHHETLRGTGYPRGLAAGDLSVPARIMAIADIFEALTATDRPYKKGKTLSEAVRILWRFKRDGHIDPDLFDLFLTSGVHLRYAERFMDRALIDECPIEEFLGRVPQEN
jgi:HD-GYP domain-containing protein (c-di-GMP phosphodiesterase class II)